MLTALLCTVYMCMYCMHIMHVNVLDLFVLTYIDVHTI